MNISARPHFESKNASMITVGSFTRYSEVFTFILSERKTMHTKDREAINIVVVGK